MYRKIMLINYNVRAAISLISRRSVSGACAASSVSAHPSSSIVNSKAKVEHARKETTIDKIKQSQQSTAETDEKMRRAMEGIAGDGGEAGLELEDGKPVSMKRGVRENMFRYI